MSEVAVQEIEAPDLSPRVRALYARFQEFQDTPDPRSVITDDAVRSWLSEVEAVAGLVTPGSVAGLGPHTSSVDNLRLAARKAAEHLQQLPWLSGETKAGIQGFLDRNPVY